MSRRRTSASRRATVPSMTSSPTRTWMPPSTAGSTSTCELDLRGRRPGRAPRTSRSAGRRRAGGDPHLRDDARTAGRGELGEVLEHGLERAAARARDGDLDQPHGGGRPCRRAARAAARSCGPPAGRGRSARPAGPARARAAGRSGTARPRRRRGRRRPRPRRSAAWAASVSTASRRSAGLCQGEATRSGSTCSGRAASWPPSRACDQARARLSGLDAGSVRPGAATARGPAGRRRRTGPR